jgi:hypothetical protein
MIYPEDKNPPTSYEDTKDFIANNLTKIHLA